MKGFADCVYAKSKVCRHCKMRQLKDRAVSDGNTTDRLAASAPYVLLWCDPFKIGWAIV